MFEGGVGVGLGRCGIIYTEIQSVFDKIFVKLADNEDKHKILNKFNFCPCLTISMRVTCP